MVVEQSGVEENKPRILLVAEVLENRPILQGVCDTDSPTIRCNRTKSSHSEEDSSFDVFSYHSRS